MSRGENCFEGKNRLKVADLAEPARAGADKKGQTWIGGLDGTWYLFFSWK